MTLHNHHLIPKHAGGTNDPRNILRCNVAMHAWLHEQRWKETKDEWDFLAWQGLLNIISKEDIIRRAHQLKGPAISMAKKGSIPWNKGKRGVYSPEARERMRQARANRQYRITHPSGKTEVVSNLAGLKSRIPYRALVNKLTFCKGNTHLILEGPNKGWGIERV